MLHCLWISCGWDIAHPTAQPPARWVSTSAYGARQAGASNGGPNQSTCRQIFPSRGLHHSASAPTSPGID
jgi:hypothetical protein